ELAPHTCAPARERFLCGGGITSELPSVRAAGSLQKLVATISGWPRTIIADGDGSRLFPSAIRPPASATRNSLALRPQAALLSSGRRSGPDTHRARGGGAPAQPVRVPRSTRGGPC